MLQAVRSGEIDRQRLDQSVRKIWKQSFSRVEQGKARRP